MNSSNKPTSRGMVFGVFDGLHPGHKHFLSAAAAGCSELIVVVTVPEVVALLKGKVPANDLATRISKIKAFDPRLIVIPGDKQIRTWDVLKTYSPDKIFLGYDQQAIAAELEKMKIPHEFIESHEPNKYKSSLTMRTG